MLAMVFVNDIAGIRGLPWWMYHMADSAGSANYDGMTVVDWVFPAFLFVMGMSVPAALQGRVARGEPAWRIALHVLLRGGALILLGFFKINQTGAIAAIGWPAGVWNVLMFVCAIATFGSLRSVRGTIIVRGVGAIGLAALAFVHLRYAGAMTPKWWDILGIIGWAYLATAMVWAVVRHSRAGMAAAIGMLLYLFVLDAQGWLRGPSIFGFVVSDHLSYGSTIGTHAAVAVAGMLLAGAFLPGSPETDARGKARFVVSTAAMLFLAALMTYPHFHVNKDNATPAWAMLSAGATALLFLGLWWWVDFRGGVRASWLLRVAGQHALLIYLLQSMLYPLMQILADAFGGKLLWLVQWHGQLAVQGPWVGCGRGAGMAVALTLAAWGLSRLGVRLKL